MSSVDGHDGFLAGARVDPAVLSLRPDYRALLVAVAGVRGGPSDEASDAALRRAEVSVRARLAGVAPETLPEIAAWRDAFGTFGVKPRQARSSVEALLRRVDAGLPRIDRLTDAYNAVSVERLIPVAGEDLDRYVGSPWLVRAAGDEQFDTVADGEPVVVHPDPGEVVWRDDLRRRDVDGAAAPLLQRYRLPVLHSVAKVDRQLVGAEGNALR